MKQIFNQSEALPDLGNNMSFYRETLVACSSNVSYSLDRPPSGADLGGGCRGCTPPPPAPLDDLRFSNTTGILQKKK